MTQDGSSTYQIKQHFIKVSVVKRCDFPIFLTSTVARSMKFVKLATLLIFTQRFSLVQHPAPLEFLFLESNNDYFNELGC
jgi:hypothetical protein